MENIKITAKEIKRGLENRSVIQEILNMMPYNRQDRGTYARTLVTTNNLFKKCKLNIVSLYPAKLGSLNNYYEILDKKGNVVWRSGFFKLGSYKSHDYLIEGMNKLDSLKGENIQYEIYS